MQRKRNEWKCEIKIWKDKIYVTGIRFATVSSSNIHSQPEQHQQQQQPNHLQQQQQQQ